MYERVTIGPVTEYDFCSKMIFVGDDDLPRTLTRDIYKFLTTKQWYTQREKIPLKEYVSAMHSAALCEMPHQLLRQLQLNALKRVGGSVGAEAQLARDWVHEKTADITDDQLADALDKMGISYNNFLNIVSENDDTLRITRSAN